MVNSNNGSFGNNPLAALQALMGMNQVNNGNSMANNLMGNYGSFNLGDIVGGLQGLAGIYFGNKNLKLAKDQFNTNTAFANTNLGNQAKLINNSLEARYKQALASKQGTAEGASMASLEDYMKKASVDGSPIQ